MATAPYRCAQCGEPLYSDSAICPACGAFRSLETDDAQTAPPAASPPAEAAPARRLPPGAQPTTETGAPWRAVPRYAPTTPWPPAPGTFPEPPPRLSPSSAAEIRSRPAPVARPDAPVPERVAPPVAPVVRPEPPLAAGPDPRRLRALPPEPGPFSEAPTIPPVTGPGFAAYAPEPDELPEPAELMADFRPAEAAAPRMRAGLPPRKAMRRALLIGGVLVAGLVVVWIFSGSSPTPVPEDTATSAPATETPAEPEVPGIKVGTVWTRIPVAVVDGSGGKMTASGPFRLRVDGQVYTIATEAMPIIPVEPGSRVEARAVSGTVTLTVTP